MTTYELLKQAILERKQVIAIYDNYVRELSPHALGTKNGVAQCIAYQFGGDSSRGPIALGSTNNWRCLTVSKFRNVKVREGKWYTATDHSRPNTCLDHVDVEVAHPTA
jgi:hypothetical protein